jgi:predicted DNA-binding antitoxin AbrB/MazE fold protein
MTKTLEAVYDGEVLRPGEPLDLEPNTRVRVTIEVEHEEKEPYAFLRTACSLNLEGLPGWSTRLDYYLYGTRRDEDA